MSRIAVVGWGVACAAFLAACGGGGAGDGPSPPPDTGAQDTGTVDTGVVDTGALDTTGDDTGVSDSGFGDSSALDADATEVAPADATDAVTDATDATDAVADGADATDAAPAVCGNGIVEPGEGCDDGNVLTEACAYGAKSCTVCASDCTQRPGATSFCGDGKLRGAEACDDGNTVAGDGCSATCTLEPSVTCVGEPSVCKGICGDGIAGPGEKCDDGNLIAGDGCSAACAFEATCGNGTVEPGEVCDRPPGEGCSASCDTWDAGSACSTAIDLRDPTKVTVSGNATTYAGSTAGSALTSFGAPSCTARAVGSPRVLHRFAVGARPAALTIETLPTGGAALKDSVLWAITDCAHPTWELSCGEDADLGLLSRLDTKVLPAGTSVFVAIAGYRATDAGAYTLRVTERPGRLGAAAACAAPTPVAPGTFGATIAGTGTMRASCGGDGPEAVYALTFSKPSDVRARLATPDRTADLALWLAGAPCAAASEIACVDATGPGESESLLARALPPGTYYLVVDGVDAITAGTFALDLDVVSVLGAGAACDPADATARCADGLACTGAAGAGTCTGTDLLLVDFSSGSLAPLTVVDAAGDGISWAPCDPSAASCPADNPTGSASGGAYARILDVPAASLVGEMLRTAPIAVAGLSRVTLSFDHRFRHNPTSSDEGRVEISLDGTTWNPLVVLKADAGGHATYDLSSAVAGAASFAVRFVYTDQTSTASVEPWAYGWSIDDVRVTSG